MCDPTGNVSFSDSNDVINFGFYLAPWGNAAFKADVVSYIKSRMASVPGVGTVSVTEETRGSVNL